MSGKSTETVNNVKSNETNNGQKDGPLTSTWAPEHEDILIDWADKAMCYRWLHEKSNQKYSVINAWFTIPVIILSTITGTANFAQERFPPEYKDLAVMSIGSINIFAGILTTIHQYLKIGELNEAHRASSISWSKFYRRIRVELTKRPSERREVLGFLNACEEEFGRLIETSPPIDENIIKRFKVLFDTGKINGDIDNVSNNLIEDIEEGKETLQEGLNTAVKKAMKIETPEICDTFKSTREFLFNRDLLSEKSESVEINDEYILELLERRSNENKDKEKEQQLLHEKSEKVRYVQSEVDRFIREFQEINKRKPMKHEIIDNVDPGLELHVLKEFTNKKENDTPLLNEDAKISSML